MFSILKIIILILIFSSTAWADDDWGRHRHGHHHGHHHRDHYPYYRRDIVYVPAPPPVVQYVPVAPRYYAPPPVSYYRYDQRSPTGLVGSIVGGAVGYEVGGGDPLAAGVGAAAGAIIGNGRY